MKGHVGELSILDIIRILWKRKIIILICMVVFVGVTVIVASTMKPVYEAKAIIAPVGQQQAFSPVVSTITTQMGLSPGQTTNVAEIINLLQSNILREKVITKYKLTPVLFGDEVIRLKTEDEKMWASLRFLQKALKINFRQKDNIIEITMQIDRPYEAAKIIEYTLAELNDHMSNEAKRVAKTNKKYLESILSDTFDPFIKNKIYNLIAQQIEASMMAEVKENFAFKIIDPPKIPDRRIKPNKSVMVGISFILSLMLGVFIAFVWEHITNIRKDIL